MTTADRMVRSSETIPITSAFKCRIRVIGNEPENLYNAFYELIEFDGGDPDGMIVLPAEGWHRTIFINKNALDYVMLPTHQFEAGRTEADALDLESDRGRSSDRPAD